ncbi:hypothetical protein ACKVWC_006208 [Pyricularia oryzae]
MFSHPIPQALGPLLVLLYLSSPALAWDHLDRKHPTHRTLSTFLWTRPFLDLELKAENPHADPKDLDRDIPGGFHVYCEATKTFAARQLTAADLHKPPPDGLEPWAAALDVALHQRVYPGGWDGEELIGDGMQVLVMEYSDVPPTVRRFVEQEGVDAHTAKRWQFGVYDKPGRAGKQRRVAFGEGSSYVEDRPTAPQDKVMIFAPGALYDILPLWVADDSACKKQFQDLDKYVKHAEHNRVIAWPMTHTEPDPAPGGRKTIFFQIRASLLLETVQGRRHREAWKNVHLQASRAERRLQRDERKKGKGRRRVDAIWHDEL